jgi:hypothetical protein
MVIRESTFDGEAHLYSWVTQPIRQPATIPKVDVIATAIGRSFICPAPEVLEENDSLLPFQTAFKVFAFDGLHALQAGNPGSTQGFGEFFGSQYVPFALGMLPTMTHTPELAHVGACAPQGHAEIDRALIAKVLGTIRPARRGVAEYFGMTLP